MSGVFITFEGGEGCGKTTQLELLADVLRGRGLNVIKTREPGGTPLGKRLRRFLLYKQWQSQPQTCPSFEDGSQLPLLPGIARAASFVESPMSTIGPVPQTELLLMLADRAQHIQDVIQPALDAGQVVLCDRFVDSTTAYQGYGRGLDIAHVVALNNFVCGDCWPALTFVLDLPVQDGLSRQRGWRRRGRTDYFESESLTFHRRVRDGFLEVARQAPKRVCVIDAAANIQAVHQTVLVALTERLPSLG